VAKSPQQNVFGRPTETTVRPFDAPAAPDPAPGSLGEIFQRGIESGTAGLEADLDYFRALANTLTGDKEAAEINVANARIDESLSAAPLQGIAEFGEFLDAPTFSGLIEQAVLAGGQVVPSALTTIAGAGVGGLAGAAVAGGAKLALRGATKQAAERVVKDSLERTVKGVADPEEQLLAELSFRQAKREFAAGAFTGAGTAEYVPLAGSNLSEALDAGLELTPEQAARAAGVALPQALIGVGSEAALLKLVGSVAGKRATKEGGVFSTLAKDIASRTAGGAALESATEGLQESIAIANRQDLDPTFSDEDANLRRMQAIFAGAIGGGAAAGAGSAVVGSASAAVRSVTDGSLLDATANVTAKARDLLDRAQRQRMDAKVDEEQYNVVMSGMTTPESQADINAQLNAMLDPSSSKQSVWVAGTEPQYNAAVNKSRPIQIDGNLAYAAFVPGQGTIVSTSRTIVDEVVAAGASDAALAAALGYSKPKDAADPSDIVVQVLDSQGGVVSEEAVGNAPEDFEAAMQAASKIMPNGGSLRQTTVEKALEERAQRAAKERGPTIKQVDEVVSEPAAPPRGAEAMRARVRQIIAENPNATISDIQRGLRAGYNPTRKLLDEMAASGEILVDGAFVRAVAPEERGPTIKQMDLTDETSFDAQKTEDTYEELADGLPFDSSFEFGDEEVAMSFGRKSDPTKTFDNTADARAAYEKQFGRTNWEEPRFAAMTEAALYRAAELQQQNPSADVQLRETPTGYDLVMVGDPALDTDVDQAGLRKIIAGARNAADARDSRVRLLNKATGKYVKISLPQLVTLSRDLAKKRGFNVGESVTNASRVGFQEVLADFYQAGYELQVDGVPFDRLAIGPLASVPEANNVPALTLGGQTYTLNELLTFGGEPTPIRLKKREDPEKPKEPKKTFPGVRPTVRFPEMRSTPIPDADSPTGLRQRLTRRGAIPTLEAQLVELQEERARLLESARTRSAGTELDAGRVAEVEARIAELEAEGRSIRERIASSLGPAFYGLTYDPQVSGPATYLSPEERGDVRQELRRASEADLPRLQEIYSEADGLRAETERTPLGAMTPFQRERLAALNQKITDVQAELSEVYTREQFEGQSTDVNPLAQVEADLIKEGVPLSRLNIEDDPKFQTRAKRANRKRVVFAQATFPAAGSFPSLAREVINRAINKLRLRNPVSVFGVGQLSSMSQEEVRALFNDPRVADAVLEQMQQLLDDPNAKGRYLGFENAHFIIVDERGASELDVSLTAAHELGHALLEEERNATLDNKSLRTRLEKAFEKAKAAQDAPSAYQGELGFEEWYADQVAIWAQRLYLDQKKYSNAKNFTEAHFRRIAQKIIDMFKTLSSEMRRRFGKEARSVEFTSYMDRVVNNARRRIAVELRSSARGEVYPRSAARDAVYAPTYRQRAMVQAVNDVIVEKNGEALAMHWRKRIQDLLKNPNIRPLMKIVRTADGIMRMHAGQKIADMFYVRSQERGGGGRLGMIGAFATKVREMTVKFQEEIGNFDDPEVEAAFKLVVSDKATTELEGKARQIREYLEEFYRDYVGPSNSDIGFRPNFFPIALNLVEIESRQEEFVDLLTAGNTGISRARAVKAVYDLARYNRSIQNDDNATIEFDPLNPAKDAEESLVLTRGIDPEVLSDAGFLQEPQDALVNYMRSVIKRVEWNKATKDAEGNNILEQEMEKLSPEDQEVAREIIGTYLGYQTNPISPMWRKINSWGQFIQFVTILPFATIASLPELAGPVIASKEFSAVTEGFKQIVATIKNRKEAEQLARDIGVVSNETIANAWVTQAEQDYMDPKVRALSDGFFKLIGLDFFTRFSREFAAGMGVQFITKHARNEFNNPRSERYLSELGLTKEDVMAWLESGRKLSTPEGKKVKQALQRFVESSILRPNAAERPIWASDPHWALIWQLKSYFYAYSKVILGGIRREGQSRRAEGERPGASLAIFGLTAVVTMPLAMMAMELREYAKYGLAWLIPGIDASDKYFRTDRMDWPTYAFEVIDRSGFLGPLTMGAMMHQNAQWDKSPILPLLGPTAETIDTAFSNGWRIDRTLRDRLFPVVNQL
jgi:hypothetical protein